MKKYDDFYEFEDFYQVVELYIKEGEKIPKPFDIIEIEQHDEIAQIKKKIEISKIIKKEIRNNELYIIAICEEITK